MTIPNWVKKYRAPKTEIKNIGGRYYVYEVSSCWDAGNKRTRKISGRIIGKITKEGGFIKRETYHEKVTVPIMTKEYGVVALLNGMMSDSLKQLERHFPDEWQQIVVTAYARLVHQSPLKNIGLHYEHSYLSEIYPNTRVDSKVIGSTIQLLGKKREQIRKYFKSIMTKGEYMLIDGTHVLNKSDASLAEIGYNSQRDYSPQVNLMFIFDRDSKAPVYYRLLPGNIREVKSFKLSLKESGLTNAVIIADKGFYSKSNIQELEDNNLLYIIPLQRSSLLINYEPLRPLDKRKLSGYFTYANRTIWYHKQEKVTLFLDEELRLSEERDYLRRIDTHPENYSLESFHEKQHGFGTIALLSNLSDSQPETLYAQYKSRAAIEQLFDSLKNLLAADRTYMRTDDGLEGWMFLHFIALSWYYRIYSALLSTKLLSRFSVADVLARASKIQKININAQWLTSEVTAKSSKLLADIGCPVT